MPRWFNRLRAGLRSPEDRPLPSAAQGGTALMERPSLGALELPADSPAGIDGALWASWAARWQEF